MTKFTKISTERAFEKNVWNAIADEIEVEGGAEVEKEFTKLKEKCSRYNRNLKSKSNRYIPWQY